MKKILAVLIASLSLHAGAFAQAAPAADPAASAAAREMFDAMHLRDTLAASLHQMQQSLPAMMRAQMTNEINGDAGLDAAGKARALQKMEAELPRAMAGMNSLFNDPTLVDEMMQEMTPLYARNFTVDEIRQIAVFYQSPVGQKTLARMPVLMNESMMISQRLVAPRIQKMMQESMRGAAQP